MEPPSLETKRNVLISSGANHRQKIGMIFLRTSLSTYLSSRSSPQAIPSFLVALSDPLLSPLPLPLTPFSSSNLGISSITMPARSSGSGGRGGGRLGTGAAGHDPWQVLSAGGSGHAELRSCPKAVARATPSGTHDARRWLEPTVSCAHGARRRLGPRRAVVAQACCDCGARWRLRLR